MHTFVTECEAIDKRENIRDARKLSELGFAVSIQKTQYLDAKKNAEHISQTVYNESLFSALLKRSEGKLTPQQLRENLHSYADAQNEELARIEDKYFPTIVALMVKDDIRLSSASNDTTLRA